MKSRLKLEKRIGTWKEEAAATKCASNNEGGRKVADERDRRPEEDKTSKEKEEGKCLFFPLTRFLCSTALYTPFPSGQPGGQAGHRRPSFLSPCWPCWPFKTRSSSGGRTPARRGTKGGWTSGVWWPGTCSPSTEWRRRTEDGLASYWGTAFKKMTVWKYEAVVGVAWLDCRAWQVLGGDTLSGSQFVSVVLLQETLLRGCAWFSQVTGEKSNVEAAQWLHSCSGGEANLQ